MSAPLYYYATRASAITGDDLKTLGLGGAFGDRQPTARRTTRGPDGQAGLVLGDARAMGKLPIGYYPDDQHWTEIDRGEGEPPLWIGWHKEHPPGPASLLRDDALPGADVVMGDGQKWRIPIVRRWSDEDERTYCQLPQQVRKTAAGWMPAGVMREHRALWEISNRYFNSWLDAVLGAEQEGGDQAELDFDEHFEYAASLIARNYRLGPWAVSELGLLDGGASGRAMDEANQTHLVGEHFKKKARAALASASRTPDSGLGDRGPSPDTGPPLVSSTSPD